MISHDVAQPTKAQSKAYNKLKKCHDFKRCTAVERSQRNGELYFHFPAENKTVAITKFGVITEHYRNTIRGFIA